MGSETKLLLLDRSMVALSTWLQNHANDIQESCTPIKVGTLARDTMTFDAMPPPVLYRKALRARRYNQLPIVTTISLGSMGTTIGRH